MTAVHRFFLAILITIGHANIHAQGVAHDPYKEKDRSVEDQTDKDDFEKEPIINKIIISGVTLLPVHTIENKLPYIEGEEFSLAKTNYLIHKLYQLGYFKQVTVKTESIGKNRINLHVILAEKTPLQKVTFTGNKNIKTELIEEKLNIKELHASEETELKKCIRIIKKMYAEKDYQFTKVDLKYSKKNGRGIAEFIIHEGPISHVKRVRFTGNKTVSEKMLRTLLYTREEWLMSFLDKSGSYQPQAIEADKYFIENFYQSRGFIHAKVYDTQIIFNDTTKDITVIFDIDEGDRYTIASVDIHGAEEHEEKILLSIIPIHVNDWYSKEKIRVAIDRLKRYYGNKGYIYSDVEPSIQPDETQNNVAVAFYVEKGPEMRLNRINILGNEKSRDKVIRRQLLIDEGDLITSFGMEESKNLVSSLGYFDPKNGVNWKINRIDDKRADLDLVLKEVKTGHFETRFGYGGSPTNMASPSSSFNVSIDMTERNMFGTGIQWAIKSSLSKEEKSFNVNLTQPWLFDKPIKITFDTHLNRSGYDDIKKVQSPIQEQQSGATIGIGFAIPRLIRTAYLFQFGYDNVEHLDNNNKTTTPQASVPGFITARDEFQRILNNRFKSGKFLFLQHDLGQNTLNHHMHPNHGVKWHIFSRLALPAFNDTIGFHKIEADAHWYTPLIDEYGLILHIHAHGGWVTQVGSNSIPFKELYHVGGPSSVRGWLFGQIGPQWTLQSLVEDTWTGDSIGGKKAAYWNFELIFPITKDMSMKGVLFYDSGSGWDTPDKSIINPNHLINNDFTYRHSIGFGLRLLQPTPIKVDWGFKLDKRTGEKTSEVSFSSYYDF